MAPSTATSDAPAGEGAQGGGHSDGDAHRSCSGVGCRGETWRPVPAIVLNRLVEPAHSRDAAAGLPLAQVRAG